MIYWLTGDRAELDTPCRQQNITVKIKVSNIEHPHKWSVFCVGALLSAYTAAYLILLQ